MSYIGQGKNTPLNKQTGSIPDVGSALLDWFQPMVFGIVTKSTQGFQVVETVVNVNFMGVIQPLTTQRLLLKPEGQRAWKWYWVHADPSLELDVDAVISYESEQYRVMAKKDYDIYGYVEYELCQDYTGAGPTPVEEP